MTFDLFFSRNFFKIKNKPPNVVSSLNFCLTSMWLGVVNEDSLFKPSKEDIFLIKQNNNNKKLYKRIMKIREWIQCKKYKRKKKI